MEILSLLLVAKTDPQSILNIVEEIYFSKLPLLSNNKLITNRLTRAAATEMGTWNITCNAICPGIVRTEMSAKEITVFGVFWCFELYIKY